MNWNAFDNLPSEPVKHGDEPRPNEYIEPCLETTVVGHLTVHCEKLHERGETSHSAVVRNEAGQAVLIEWK